MSNKNIKTYADLLADTENTWEAEESLEELLFDCDAILEEAVNNSHTFPIKKGDIIMANNGTSNREAGMPVLSPHRIFIIEDAVGEPGRRIFRGYLMSSQVHKANYYNSAFPNNVYIEDYASILARGPVNHKEVFINLSDLYMIEEKLMTSGGMWKGHAKQEFIDFIDAAAAAVNDGKSIVDKYWLTA